MSCLREVPDSFPSGEKEVAQDIWGRNCAGRMLIAVNFGKWLPRWHCGSPPVLVLRGIACEFVRGFYLCLHMCVYACVFCVIIFQRVPFPQINKL